MSNGEKVSWVRKAKKWFRLTISESSGKVLASERLILHPTRGPQSVSDGDRRPARRRMAFLMAFSKVTRMQYESGMPNRKARRSMARSIARRKVAA